MVTSSTARLSGQVAVEIVTAPEVLLAGDEHWSMLRQRAISCGIGGPVVSAGWGPVPPLSRRPGPPLYGKVLSAVPWIWITETGAGDGQSPRRSVESGPMAAKMSVSQASRSASA